MTESVAVSPPNSLILVMDHQYGELPEEQIPGPVLASESCVVIGTQAASDGETTVTLTSIPVAGRAGELVFEGTLLTPSRVLSVCNARNEVLLAIPVLHASTRVMVFVNDRSEPDQIIIVAK